MTRALRLGLPAIAITVAVALALSDWPIGWHLWLDHPYIAAFAAGLALLFVAGAVVDAHIRRREARRWHGLGFAAAGEFASILYDTAVAMAALSGTDDGYRLRVDIEFHLALARDRATELLRADVHEGGPCGEEALDLDALAPRLSLLVRDGTWRGSASQTLRVARSHLVEAVSRWTSTFAVLGDDEQFNRIARTVTIMDLITAVHIALVAIRSADDAEHLDPTEFSTFVTQWATLLASVDTELDFWNERRRVASRVDLSTLERHAPSRPLPVLD